MTIYIDTNNQLHDIDDNFTYLLPAGCVVATQEQITAAQAPKPLTPQGQIAQLEATVTQRRIRESVLGVDNGWLKDLEAQIDAIRATIPK